MIDPVKRQKEAKRLKNQGLTVREIARKFNTSLGTISGDLYGKEKKFTLAQHRKRALEWGKRRQQAYLLREQGLEFKEIGKRLNVSSVQAAELYKAYKNANVLGDTSWRKPLPTNHEESKTAYDTLFLLSETPAPPSAAPKKRLPKFNAETQRKNRKLVVQLREQGLMFVEIAKQLGVSSNMASHLYHRWVGRV